VLADVIPDLQEHVTQHLFGLSFVLQNAKGKSEYPGSVQLVQLPQRLFIVGLETSQEHRLLLLTKTFWTSHLDFIVAAR
jgi:hypothetical protein